MRFLVDAVVSIAHGDRAAWSVGRGDGRHADDPRTGGHCRHFCRVGGLASTNAGNHISIVSFDEARDTGDFTA